MRVLSAAKSAAAVASRVARCIIGTTLLERREIQQAVRDLYNLRSKLVHRRARRPDDTLPDTRCASRGLEICTQAVRAMPGQTLPYGN
jgi:hypothetical protein